MRRVGDSSTACQLKARAQGAAAHLILDVHPRPVLKKVYGGVWCIACDGHVQCCALRLRGADHACWSVDQALAFACVCVTHRVLGVRVSASTKQQHHYVGEVACRSKMQRTAPRLRTQHVAVRQGAQRPRPE